MITGKRIKDRRKSIGMSAEMVAEAIGISPATVYRYESSDISAMGIDKLGPIADALHTSPAYLMGWVDDPNPKIFDAIADSTSADAHRIPVFGTIPAGIPMEAIEDILDWEELPVRLARGGKEFFALRIKGDSMSPKYMDGDVVIFQRQDICESGQDCAVMVNGDDATFKRVIIKDAGITLQPLNSAFDPLFFTNREVTDTPVRIIGIAVELRRKL